MPFLSWEPRVLELYHCLTMGDLHNNCRECIWMFQLHHRIYVCIRGMESLGFSIFGHMASQGTILVAGLWTCSSRMMCFFNCELHITFPYSRTGLTRVVKRCNGIHKNKGSTDKTYQLICFLKHKYFVEGKADHWLGNNRKKVTLG